MNTINLNINIMRALAKHVCNFKDIRPLAKSIQIKVTKSCTYYTASQGHYGVTIRDMQQHEFETAVYVTAEKLLKMPATKCSQNHTSTVRDDFLNINLFGETLALPIEPSKAPDFARVWGQSVYPSMDIAQVNPEYLVSMQKCCRMAYALKPDSYTKLVLWPNGGGLAQYSHDNFYGVIMPLRCDEGFVKSDWIENFTGVQSDPATLNLRDEVNATVPRLRDDVATAR